MRPCLAVILGLLAAPVYAAMPYGVEAWHQAGVRGAGVKVAVLDSGFRGYRGRLGQTLPPTVTVRSFCRAGLEARDSEHGVRCGEVVHALAPDAELLFANWEPDRPESFVEAVKWCRREGARIIVCSVIMPGWSDGEGGGAVHEQLAAILGSGRVPGDVLAVACAGNLAQRSWSGKFNGDRSGTHVWSGGRTENTVTPWGDERVSIELYGRPGATYALDVVDTATRQAVVASLAPPPSDRCTATARFRPELGHTYRLRVRLTAGEPGVIHVAALGAWLEHSTAAGSIPFPGDGAEWLTVGAIEPDGRRAAYSSCGRSASRPKPDLAAAVPFPLLGRSAPFSGTSAAAPQAAGLAALVWSRHPDWTADRVRRELCRACQDVGPPGLDVETGHGRLALPARLP